MENIPLINQLTKDSKILYYDGSFDPFHAGHLSALVKAVQTFEPEIVFVLSHEKNKYKPNLIEFNHRTQLIRLAISTLPISIRRIIQVLNTPGQNHSIKEKLTNLSDNVAVLMGTDSLRFFNFKRNPKISKHFVSIRSGETIDPSIVDKVIPIYPEINDCSSTKIRKLYSDFYLDKIDSIGSNYLMNFMTNDANNHIQKNRLYFPSFDQLISNIEEHLSSTFPNEPIQRLFSEPTLSQNYCFRIGVKFIKCYTKFSHQIESSSEIGGIKLLNDLRIEIKPLSSNVIKHEKLHHFSYFVAPFVNSSIKLSDLLTQQNVELFPFFRQAGKSLAQLHSSTHTSHTFLQIDPSALENHLIKMTNKLKNITNDQMNQFNSMKQNYINNPGRHCLTHGDPNLSNFIINDDKIFLVDLDRLWHCHQMGIVGFPADDYFRFVASVSWFANKVNDPREDNSIVKKLIEEFSESYFNNLKENVEITQDALKFYQFYWFLRDLGDLGDN